MRKEYDFTRAKRAAEVPYLARLQAESVGKTRITVRVTPTPCWLSRRRPARRAAVTRN
jgi:hypothetical protein